MYKNIMVPISFDEAHEGARALKVAKSLADKGARITLVHVIEHVPAYAISYMPLDYVEEARNAIAARLEELSGGLENGAGVLVEGHAGRTIVDWAEENEIDCIILASHRPGAADLVLGSTAARVVRHATCSVHVVR